MTTEPEEVVANIVNLNKANGPNSIPVKICIKDMKIEIYEPLSTSKKLVI